MCQSCYTPCTYNIVHPCVWQLWACHGETVGHHAVGGIHMLSRQDQKMPHQDPKSHLQRTSPSLQKILQKGQLVHHRSLIWTVQTVTWMGKMKIVNLKKTQWSVTVLQHYGSITMSQTSVRIMGKHIQIHMCIQTFHTHCQLLYTHFPNIAKPWIHIAKPCRSWVCELFTNIWKFGCVCAVHAVQELKQKLAKIRAGPPGTRRAEETLFIMKLTKKDKKRPQDDRPRQCRVSRLPVEVWGHMCCVSLWNMHSSILKVTCTQPCHIPMYIMLSCAHCHLQTWTHPFIHEPCACVIYSELQLPGC